MKKLFAIGLVALSMLGLTSCGEDWKRVNSNEMIEGSRVYNYAYVKSQVTGDKYYHISGWKEYGPDGGTTYSEPYVGIELQLAVSKDVVYYYEPGLMYMLSKNYNSSYGKAIE